MQPQVYCSDKGEIHMNKKVYCKRTKAFYRIFAAAACSLLLAGCQAQKPDDYATNQGYSDNSTVSVQNTTGITKENIKVGVIHLSDPAEGSGYTYTHDLGIQGMQQNLGLSDDQIIRKINVDDSDAQKTRTAIQECIDAGCNIIFSTSWGYMQTTAEIAEQYPSVYFSHGTGYLSNGKNFNNYFGKIYQPRYLSGIVAGMNTKTNKIGYVAAMDSSNSEVTGGIDAFALGVYSVNPDAQIYVKVTNSWYSPEAEKAAAAQLLDMNCDVITQQCETLYPQTLAKARGVYSIGYNSDMSKDAPNACLCSVIWNWSAYYTSYISSIINASYDGKNYYGGMKENLVSLTELSSLCESDTADKIKEAKENIISGKFGVFDGVLKTNTGKTVGKEGKTLDDATITGKINWYYHNVSLINWK